MVEKRVSNLPHYQQQEFLIVEKRVPNLPHYQQQEFLMVEKRVPNLPHYLVEIVCGKSHDWNLC
jgi:uncharacterized protein YoaH (UPF0181 family)